MKVRLYDKFFDRREQNMFSILMIGLIILAAIIAIVTVTIIVIAVLRRGDHTAEEGEEIEEEDV